MDIAKYIFDFFTAAGTTKAGAAALVGNFRAESSLKSTNLQDSYNSSLGYSDEGYTAAVDAGTYTNFALDTAGYGLAQWTAAERKARMLIAAKNEGKSIGDLDFQLSFALRELKVYYSRIWEELCTELGIDYLTSQVMVYYEGPYDQSSSAKAYRAGLAHEIYDACANAPTQEEATPATAPVYLMRNIAVPEIFEGCQGEEVRALQALLCARGYPVNHSGYFNAATAKAVKGFQAAHGLDADGIAGKLTWTALISAEE